MYREEPTPPRENMGHPIQRPGITTGRGYKPDETPPQEPRMSDQRLPEPRINNESEATYAARIALKRVADRYGLSMSHPPPRPGFGGGGAYDYDPPTGNGIPSPFKKVTDYPKGFKRPPDWPAPDQQMVQFEKGMQKRKWWQRKPKPDAN